MPDTWEYPWFAAWDLAFHCLPLALVDAAFAKAQLLHLTREWYMHPNGQLPAYEWSFSDVNPPVHAWAAWRVYKIDRRVSGAADRAFLERIFHKLLLNFTWWVNRKDSDGHNIFQGGFLGLDNIGVFDRSAPLPVPGHLGQADGTAWMGMYSLSMLVIALELAAENPVYEDIATKFFEHFLYIAGALNGVGVESVPLWDDDDGFFYDTLHLDTGEYIPLKVRSLVGLIPLLAVETLEPDVIERMPGFRRRLRWFLRNRPDLASLVASWEDAGRRREATARAGPRPPDEAAPRPDARRGRVPVGARGPLAQPRPSRPAVRPRPGRRPEHRGLRTRRIALGDLRWQLELAGAGLVPDQLLCSSRRSRSSITTTAPTSWSTAPRIGSDRDAGRDRQRPQGTADVHLPAR